MSTRVTSPAVVCCSQIWAGVVRLCVCLFICLFAVTTLSSMRTRVTSLAVGCFSLIVCLSVHYSVCRDYAEQSEYPSQVPGSGLL
ncbi:hypothetical protein RRG08_006891 [Elysia crispata]|uniref:Uncharacterized protein n=1 Tax=Elysia crispata TaxID=231223 RepID=A0AAE0ZL44_9GAST|nr:hypothetical protein RRG08_006891 [Elysia crispata]